MKEELYDFIYRAVFSAVTAVFLFFEIYNYTDSEAITRGNVFTVVVISLIFNMLLTLYRKVKLYMIPAAAVVGLILYLTMDKNDIGEFLNSILFSLLMIGLAAFIIFLICDRFMYVNILVAAGAFIYLITELVLDYEVYPASPALVIFYIFAVLTRFLRNGMRAADPGRMRKYITFLFPFMLAFLLILIVLPKPEKPVSWNWVERLYEYTSEKINLLIHRLTTTYGTIDSDYFKISFGMNEKMLFDNNGSDKGELFEITPGGSVIGSLYLRGEMFNEFSDGEWHNTIENPGDFVKTDTAETRASVVEIEDIPNNSLIKENTINVRFLDIISPIVFTPAKMTAFYDVSAGKTTRGVNEHLLFSDNVSYGSEYRIAYLQMNLGNTIFTDYMNTPAAETVLNNRDFLAYRDYVGKNYTSSPVIRDSVREWLESIIDGTESDYEKMLALEEALSGFKYTLETEELPSYVKNEGDFIDYFILEKREGYCVHYATVFCLLARYLGYPSRIVQGYKATIPMYAATVVDEGCGHSWPEVYFAGKGWIPFEPTPGMAEERYAGWAVDSGKIRNDHKSDWSYTETAPPIPEDTEYEDEHRGNSASLVLIAAIAGVILISFILLAAARLILQRRKYNKMNTDERYMHEYESVMQVLAEIGIKRIPEETLSEFSERTASELSDKNGDCPELADCIETHEKCIYGGKEPDAEDTEKLHDCGKKLEMFMKDYFGKTYLLHRLHLLIEKNF